MAVHAIYEAKRCLQCKKPLCQLKGCPVQTHIPEMISLFLEGKIEEAGEMLFENNPMSAVCSAICDHEAQCEGNCIQGRKNSPVQISSIEHYISEAYLSRLSMERLPSKGQKVAIIGAGPAGMTVAFKLGKLGYDITLFERKSFVGGLLRYAIPDFRLSRNIVDRYEVKLRELGIRLRPNTTIGGALTMDALFEDGYEAVFMGTGAWLARGLGVPGESLGNCHYAIDYLQYPDSYQLGDTVAVIGAGNSAMDAARTAIRTGAKKVTIYARAKVRASQTEIDYTVADGVRFSLGMGVHSITEKGPMLYKRHFDEEGNLLSEDEPQLVPADSVIIAVSQRPKDKIARTTTGITFNESGFVDVDEHMQTKREGVFSAGDVVIGPMSVVMAVRDAKIAAAAMDEYLTKKRTTASV